MKNKISLLFACFGIVATSMIAQEPVKVRKTQDPVKVEPVAKPAPKADKGAIIEPVAPAPASTVTTTPVKKQSTLQRARVKQKTATAMPVDQNKK